MIKISNLKKVYIGDEYKTHAIDGICLDIDTGCFLAVMGDSGSGKTTLLNILGGLDYMTEGEVYINNVALHELSNKELEKFRKNNISFIFQHFALMDKYTVFENVEMPLIARNVNSKKRRCIIEEKLKMLHLEGLRNKYPTQLSGGQQQRVSIARALVIENNIILADEPTGALDKNNSYELMRIFIEINKQGKTIIMVTHNEEIAKSSHQIVRLSDGKLI